MRFLAVNRVAWPLAAVLLAACAPTAGASTTVIGKVAGAGEVVSIPSSCPSGCSYGQSTAPPGTSYVVPPGGGVVTSWSVRGGATVTPSDRVRLRITTGAIDTSTVTAESSDEKPVAGAVATFATRIPVVGGEHIVLRLLQATQGAGTVHWVEDIGGPPVVATLIGDPAVGESYLFSVPGVALRRVSLAATVESDADADGFGDDTQDNCPSVANADQANADGDALGNACDADDDNDGLSDTDEAARGTNSLVADTDADGTGDATDNCATAANDQANADADAHGNACDDDDDNDGATDAVEAQRGTSSADLDTDDDGLGDNAEPRSDPRRKDTDGDGLTDGVEQGVTARIAGFAGVRGTDGTGFFPVDRDPRTKTDPRRRDTDGDRLIDGIEDLNKNGRKEAQEMSPLKADTDNDRILDGREDANRNGAKDPNETNPLRRDTDRDGLADGREDRNRDGRRQRTETDPRKRDTDLDGVSDRSDRRPLDPKRR